MKVCELCGDSLPRGRRKYHADCRVKALRSRRYTVSVPVAMRESLRRHLARARRKQERSSNVQETMAIEAVRAALKKAKREKLERELWGKLMLLGAPEPLTQYQFHEERKWRFDFAWPSEKVAAEVEGGIWIRGRHTRGKGYEEDCRKYNAAAAYGWQVFRFTGEMIKSGESTRLLMAVLGCQP